MPRGAPRIWTDDYYKRIFEVPGRVIILTERNTRPNTLKRSFRKPLLLQRSGPADPAGRDRQRYTNVLDGRLSESYFWVEPQLHAKRRI
jgi:hypothetical protein